MKQAAVIAMAGTAAAFEVDQTTLHAFDNFVAENNKMYGTKEEYMFRLKIFNENLQKINEHNEQYKDDAVWGINHMSDWTKEEYTRLLGFKDHVKQPTEGRRHHRGEHHRGEHHRGRHGHHGHRKLEAGDAVDWRDEGAVTPVKNQGQCGSCWAFSATGSMEGAYFMKNKSLPSLSEQQLVDCATKEGNQGCNGGLMDYAFDYAKANKMDSESDYPYKGRDGKCAAKGTVDMLSSYEDVTPEDPEALATALKNGPVSVAVDGASLAFQFYFGGIVKHFCGTSLDHGVLLVGMGTENDTDYWIIKNSWGASWGEKGYIRVERDMSKKSKGVCGEQSQPSQPEF